LGTKPVFFQAEAIKQMKQTTNGRIKAQVQVRAATTKLNLTAIKAQQLKNVRRYDLELKGIRSFKSKKQMLMEQVKLWL
jgi:hypothetical protein